MNRRISHATEPATPAGSLQVLQACDLPQRRITILSSRIGRDWRGATGWFDALEDLASRLAANDAVLLSSARTTIDPFADALAERHGLKLIRVAQAKDKSAAQRAIDRGALAVIYSATDRITPALTSFGLVDLTSEVGVVTARAGGLTEQLVQHVRDLGRTVTLATWPAIPRKRPDFLIERKFDSTGVPFPVDDGGWLFHWTRAQQKWPDQTQREFIDELLGAKADPVSSPLRSLQRILTTQKLCASSQAIRAGAKMVCFSAAPLSRLTEGRVYRKHRLRWDWEPYGIMIRRKVLERLGARPITYCGESQWQRAALSDQAFMQVRSNSTDWSVEQEWRVEGDLSLGELPAGSILVFVRSQQEAEQVHGLSPWSVAVIFDRARKSNTGLPARPSA